MDKLLENYINGNISYVKERLVNETYSFSEFFDVFIDIYTPTDAELKLFVRRLTGA